MRRVNRCGGGGGMGGQQSSMRALHKVSTSIPVISWIISAAFSLLFTVCPTGVGVQLEPPSGRYFLHILVTMKGQPKEEKPVPQSTGNVAL